MIEVGEGLTVAGILLEAVRRDELDLADLGRVSVFVDGIDLEDEFTREEMLDYVPPDGAVLNFKVEVHGGGGGGGDKNPLQTILTVAVIALSFYIGGGAATPAFLDSVFIRTALAATVNVAGTMAIAAAFGPDAGPKEASDRRALEGASNQVRLREMCPLQLGTDRIGADIVAQPYTQNVGDDVFLHLGLGWHYGEAQLEDLKIGETLLADYPSADIEVEHFLTPGPRTSRLYPGRVAQQSFMDQLDFTGGGVWEVHTAALAAEILEVDITLPNGLKYNADSGKVRNEEVAGQIQFAEVGTENWQAATFPGNNTTRDKNNQLLPAGSFYFNMRTNDAVRRTFGWNVPDKSKQWKVRVRAYDRDGDYPNEDGRTWATAWTALRSIELTRPIVDENIAVTFLKIRSSGDLNGTLPTITARITPIVPIFNGVDWSQKAPTSNGAALARWLVTGPAAAKPMRADQIDASITDAYQLIEANGWGAGVSVREQASQRDVLIRLGRAGRFSTYYNGRKLCFVTDWQKPIPRQVFTGRNAEGYRYRRVFNDPIHAVIVEFTEVDSSSVAGEVIVYADGYTAANAELFDNLRLDYSCTIERAFKEGRAYLAKAELQVEAHEWTAGVDSISTSYGDRVLVRHYSNLYGEAEARVDYRVFQGNLIAGVELDEPVTMEEGQTYALDVRRADGVIRGLLLTTTPGTSRRVMFAAPRAAGVAPEKDDLIAFGRVDLVTEDVEIVDIERAGEWSARIRAVRYIGEELVQAETGPIPPLVSGITPRPVAPTPRVVGATGDPDGVTVAFELDPVRGALLQSTAVRWRRTAEAGQPPNQWNSLEPLPADARQARTPAVADAVATLGDSGGEFRVDVELRSVLRNGSISDPAYANGILVERQVPKPVNVIAVGQMRVNPDGSTYPVLAVSADPIEAGDIQDLVVEISNDAGTWRSAGQPLPSRNPRGDFRAVQGGESLYVRVRWRLTDGWVSSWIQTPGAVSIPGGTIATDTTYLAGIASPLFAARLVDVEDLAAANAAEVEDILAGYPSITDAVADAVAARDASAVFASNADGSASAAAGSAAVALVAADDAGDYAISAQGSATSASTSAGNASTFASQASSARDGAVAASVSAGTSADSSAASAATATTQASNASDSAASASLSATIAASAGINALNKEATFASFRVAGAVSAPPGWSPGGSGGTTGYRVAGLESPNAWRQDTNAGATYAVVQQVPGVGPGWYVIEAAIRKVEGNLGASGVYLEGVASGSVVQNHSLRFTVDPSIDGSPAPAGGGNNGATYRFSKLVQLTNTSINQLNLWAMSGWTNWGSASVYIEWHRCSVRPATDAEIQARQVLSQLGASVSQQAQAMLDLKTNYALARYQVAAVTPGGAAVLFLASDNYGSVAGITADQIYFGENTYFDNATDTLRTVTGTTARVLALGAAFGTTGDLIQWEGPSSVAFSAMSRANARFYSANAEPYLGGTAFPTAGGFQVAPSSDLVVGTRLGAGVCTTSNVTLNFTGNTGTVSVAWNNVSGDEAVLPVVGNGTLATTQRFRKTIAAGERTRALFAYAATDGGSGQTRTGVVSAVLLDNT